MSRVYRRNGAWTMDYSVDGRRVRKRIGRVSEKIAQAVLKRIEGEIIQEKYTPERYSGGKAFVEIADLYWETKGKHRAQSYKYMFREIRARFGARRVGAISPTDVQRFYNDIVERASVSTANRNVVFFGSIFNWAIKFDHFFGKNPCAPIERRKEPNHRIRYLSAEEMVRLLPVCHPRLMPVVFCAITTGMRRQEILDLRWENVDMEQGIIHILKTKTGMSRSIQVTKRLRGILESLGPKKEGSVFNLPLIMLRRLFGKALVDAEIERFKFHDTRHTFASWYAMKTNDLGALREILGHQNIQMTLRYAHLCTGHHAAKLAEFEKGMPIEFARLNGPAGTQAAPAALLELHIPEKTEENNVKA